MADITLEEPQFAEADAVDAPADRPGGGRGTIVTLTTVIALLVATALTVLGLGAADTAVTNVDSTSWLWSASRGEVDRVNGVTARVDTRAKITDAQNHEIEITQNDRYLVLRDLETGQITALDLTTLQTSAVLPTTPGRGVTVALHGDVAFIVDGVQGIVRQLNPRTLTPTGEPLTLRRGIVSGGFDTLGTLWVGLPSEGTVVGIQPGPDDAGPRVTRTETVADPSHDLVLSSLDAGVAVLDNTVQRLAVVTDEVASVDLPIRRPGVLPPHTSGSPITVTVPTDRSVVLVEDGSVTELTVPGTGPIGPAVAYSGRVYVPDPQAGTVQQVTPDGEVVGTIEIPSPTGRVELEVRENFLFINSPDGADARVVDPDHTVRDVNKYQDGVLGGDPPPPPPEPPVPPPPPTYPPGAPQAVTATAGDRSATISWQPASDNGEPILRYVVEGDGITAPIEVGASQFEFTVEGLTNGQTYVFTVYAVNAKGDGPRASSNPVIPTRDIPDPPTGVTATANKDGSVSVTWSAANGQGHPISQYKVSSTSGAGAISALGAVTQTSMQIAPGVLKYGTQYAFTVIAVNDINASSEESEPSNTVIPFTVPGAPLNLAAATDPGQRGAVQVSWAAPASNGRPISGYEVKVNNGTVLTVAGTSTVITGLPDDAAAQLAVRAINEAGAGPEATASARTMGAPTVTVTGQQSDYHTVSVTLTPNNHGGNATCTLAVDGGATVQSACDTAAITLSVGGLWPGIAYTFTATITNPVGSVSVPGSVATPTIRFTHGCTPSGQFGCSTGVFAYRTASQKGTAVNPALKTGEGGVAECWAVGDAEINAEPWGMRKDNRWIGFQYQGGRAYFPFAWANIDGGDLGNIPQC
jgi:Fibronectin type III domain